MRSVIVAGINVVHAGLYCLAKNSNGRIDVPRRSPDAGSGELHRTVSHAVQGYRRTGKSEASSQIALFNHSVPPLSHHYWMKDSSDWALACAGDAVVAFVTGEEAVLPAHLTNYFLHFRVLSTVMYYFRYRALAESLRLYWSRS